MLRADTTDRTLVAAGQQACGDHGACAWPATQQINALTAASRCAGGARRSRDQRTFNFDHTAHRTGALWADSRRIMGDDAAWAARTRAQVSAWGPTTSAAVHSRERPRAGAESPWSGPRAVSAVKVEEGRLVLQTIFFRAFRPPTMLSRHTTFTS